jgi:hypothetical protein
MAELPTRIPAQAALPQGGGSPSQQCIWSLSLDKLSPPGASNNQHSQSRYD